MAKGMNPHMHACMQLCWQCRDTCQDTLFNYNLERDGSRIDADNIRLMIDCMEICQTAADFLRRNSCLASIVCVACADACEACADSCESMDEDYTVIQRCAEICRQCERACRTISRMQQAAA